MRGVIHTIQHKHDMGRRHHRATRHCFKGCNLLRLLIIEESKVLLFKAGDRVAGCIGHKHIQNEVMRGLRCAFSILSRSGYEGNGSIDSALLMVGMNSTGALWIPDQRVRVGGPVATGLARAEGIKRVSGSLGEGSRRVCCKSSQRPQFYALSVAWTFIAPHTPSSPGPSPPIRDQRSSTR